MVIGVRKNYYEILGLTPDSDSQDVKSAYRKLARKYHPDVNKTPDSEKKFKDVLEAYEVLSDEKKRKQYDMLNGFYKSPKQKVKSEGARSEYKKTSEQKTYEQPKKEKTNDNATRPTFEDSKEAFQKNDFKSAINDILDGIAKEKKNKRKPKNGEDIFAEVSITLEDSVRGTSRVVNVLHKELCPNCEGRRFINGSKCSVCNGTGEFIQHKKINVKIPANIKNCAKLRIQGEGNPGFYGGASGNLYLTVKVEQNPYIKIDGNDILYKLPITPFEAVLGGKIPIPAFNGRVILTLPKNTLSGQKFRLAGEGIKTNGKFGDMIITVEIQIPKDLSDDEIRLYEKLKKLSQGNIRENLYHG